MAQVKNPTYLWDTYKPLKSLSAYETVPALWELFASGESEPSPDGKRIRQRAPLQMLEDEFGAQWRCTKDSSVSSFAIL